MLLTSNDVFQCAFLTIFIASQFHNELKHTTNVVLVCFNIRFVFIICMILIRFDLPNKKKTFWISTVQSIVNKIACGFCF